MEKKYVCLACGAQFNFSIDSDTDKEKKSCPSCGSTNILQIDPQNTYNFTGG